MTIYVTGYDGNVGRALVKRGFHPLECDVTEFLDVQRVIRKQKPNLLVHLAAETNVNWCEEPANKEKALRTNFHGASFITQVCDDNKVPFILLSTDHIFSGSRWGRYKEMDIKHESPLNWYGYTKFGAEIFATTSKYGHVVRTSVLFNWEAHGLKDYVERLDNGLYIEVPTFITRSFMYVEHFANALIHYIARMDKAPQIIHISGSKTISWYDFMSQFATVFGYDQRLIVPRRKEVQGVYSPRNFKGGLNIGIAKRLRIPCPSYIDGLRQMKKDGKP